MALSKRYIEIKASSNVRDPLGQGWSDDGNVVELQHFSGMHCGGRELWSHPLQGCNVSFWPMPLKNSTSEHRACLPLFSDGLRQGPNRRLVRPRAPFSGRYQPCHPPQVPCNTGKVEFLSRAGQTKVHIPQVRHVRATSRGTILFARGGSRRRVALLGCASGRPRLLVSVPRAAARTIAARPVSLGCAPVLRGANPARRWILTAGSAPSRETE